MWIYSYSDGFSLNLSVSYVHQIALKWSQQYCWLLSTRHSCGLESTIHFNPHSPVGVSFQRTHQQGFERWNKHLHVPDLTTHNTWRDFLWTAGTVADLCFTSSSCVKYGSDHSSIHNKNERMLNEITLFSTNWLMSITVRNRSVCGLTGPSWTALQWVYLKVDKQKLLNEAPLLFVDACMSTIKSSTDIKDSVLYSVEFL